MNKYLKDKNEEIKIRISTDLKRKFLEFCKISSIKPSERIRDLINNDINNGKS